MNIFLIYQITKKHNKYRTQACKYVLSRQKTVQTTVKRVKLPYLIRTCLQNNKNTEDIIPFNNFYKI